MTGPTKCFHAASGLPGCTEDAVVLASESEWTLPKDLPLCGACAQGYARQATEYAVQRLTLGVARAADGPITITLHPLSEATP